MKIGILTQPIHWNYGGVLQCWALQQVLRTMGHEPVKLERRSRDFRKFVLKQPFAIANTAFLKLLGRRRNISLSELTKEVFKELGRLPLNRLGITVSRNLCDGVSLREAAMDMDAFIVGSDQVWREEYSPAIEDFFLGFLDESDCRRRIAYAASFGKSTGAISAKRLGRCRELLSRFDAISVRENEGSEILSRDFGMDNVPVVLDPTLLLTAENYRTIVGKKKSLPHVTTYILDNTAEKNRIVGEIATNLSLPVDRLCVRYEKDASGRSPRIEEWLHSIASADFVVTDSFHGTVFAIIFSKPFLAIGNVYRGLDRFRTLLEPLGLSSRLIAGYSQYKDVKNRLYKTIDYSQVHVALDKQRQASISFLKAALSDE